MPDTEQKWTKKATERVMHALNRADEIGGEVRDYIQDKVVTDKRYVSARKRIAKLFGRGYVSREEADTKAKVVAEKKAAVAAVTPVAVANKGFGDPSIKAQIYGRKSCPWTGRAITLFEKQKIDYDYVDLDDPEHEAKMTALTLETKQHTVPYVYLRGQFIGGFNALSEVDRLGQLEFALMSKDERANAPAHVARVEIVSRPNTDEVAPADQNPAAE